MTDTEGLAAPDALQRYADVVLRESLALREGDILFVNAEPAHAELVHALCATAHRLGAEVDVELADSLVRRARLEHAPDAMIGSVTPWAQRRLRATIGERAAFLWIGSPEHPDAFDGVPAQRVAGDLQGRSRSLRWWRTGHAGRPPALVDLPLADGALGSAGLSRPRDRHRHAPAARRHPRLLPRRRPTTRRAAGRRTSTRSSGARRS